MSLHDHATLRLSPEGGIVIRSGDDGIRIGATPATSGFLTLTANGLPAPEPVTKDAGPQSTIVQALHVKAIDAERRAVDFIASTDAIDAHDEVIDQSTWRLEDYLKNPIVLFAHDSRSLPIGTCLDVAVRNNRLECRIQFATEEMNPLAEQVWRMVQAKILRAVSVGFIPQSYRWEMRDGREVLVWADCLLKEVSVVPVPANGEALAQMKAKALETKTTPPAVPGEQPETATEKSMNEKEFAAKLEELTARNSELAITIGSANARADVAEKALRELEPRAKALETENTALKSQTEALVTERDAQKKRADELEAKTIEQEVDALVGKQITAAEKPLFVDLRKSNPDLFTKMIAQRQPMRLEERVVPSQKTNGAGSTAHLAAKLKGA